MLIADRFIYILIYSSYCRVRISEAISQKLFMCLYVIAEPTFLI